MTSKTAIVTGGSGGIGIACAEALVARGYDVVLTARTEGPLRSAAERVGARWVAADSADPGEFAHVADAVAHVDLLVHAAGVLKGTYVRKERIEDFDDVLRANLRSAVVATQAVLPKMGVGGRIIFVSSSAGQDGMKGRSAYSASKAAMSAFAQSLAKEVARDGIQVHVLAPAPVETAMLVPVPYELRTLQAKDVADAVAFLDALDPRVVLPEIGMRAMDDGPLAPAPVDFDAATEPLS